MSTTKESAHIRMRLAGWLLLSCAPFVHAQSDDAATDAGEATMLEPVTVTATRVAQPSFDVPASIDTVDAEVYTEGLGIDLSEGLDGVPGVLARDRQNYAQDTQVSIRGFGSRATFGIRGIRLYVDGIPATQPDGQGQISHFNLATAEDVEVLRGPFSALYGNAAGGVIQLFTADGGETELRSGIAHGSFDTWRANLGARGALGRSDYNVGITGFSTDGFRDHSAAERVSANGKLSFALGERGRLSLVANHLSAPDAEDPRPLTRAQAEDDPSQAAPSALEYDTRKSVEQSQAGLIWDRPLGRNHDIRALIYAGRRDVEQYLSLPPIAQASPTAAGAVIDLSSDYAGGDVRWSFARDVAGRPLTLVAGLSLETLAQQRLGFENFVGDTLGVRGRLRRDEDNDVESFDQYLQASWQFAPQWLAMAGVRRSDVQFESRDRYITDDNPDDSGEVSYDDVTPVAGLTWMPGERLRLYGAYGQGFETPTFAELGYRPDGASGLNLSLQPSSSDHYEIGAKLRGARFAAELALFRVDTDGELVVATNIGGRSTYRNATTTRRNGAELQLQYAPGDRLRADFAWTWIDAQFDDGYRTCSGSPCVDPDLTIAAGNRLPGIPESTLYAALDYGRSAGWQAGLDLRYVDAVPVDDRNSEAAPSYALVGASLGYVWLREAMTLRTFVNVDNLFDEDYMGSVVVNGFGGAYYEPGPGRTVLAGVEARFRP